MKKIFLAVLAVAALASCAKEETLAIDREAIGFGNAFVDNSVRATDPSYGTHNSLTSITVYGAVEGVNIFPGVTVEGTPGGGAWTQTDGTTQYWIAGADYIFDAVVDATAVTTDTNTGLPTSLTYDATTQTDMLHQRVTTNGKPDTNNGLVAFTFTHLLSKVKFTVENTTASTATNYRYTIKNIVFTNVYTKGDYAVPDGTWSNQTTGTYSIADITVASGATAECPNELLFIPGANVGISFDVVTEVSNDGTTWNEVNTAEKDYTGVKELVANNAYNFKVSIGLENKIEFTVTNNPTWTVVTPDTEIE